MLWYFWMNSKRIQPYIYMHPFSPNSLPIQAATQQWAKFPVLYIPCWLSVLSIAVCASEKKWYRWTYLQGRNRLIDFGWDGQGIIWNLKVWRRQENGKWMWSWYIVPGATQSSRIVGTFLFWKMNELLRSASEVIQKSLFAEAIMLTYLVWCFLRVGREGNNKGWDGWMASLTQWTWVWVNSRSWWWTGRPGVLRFMGSQRVGHDWAAELKWTELNRTEHLILTTGGGKYYYLYFIVDAMKAQRSCTVVKW